MILGLNAETEGDLEKAQISARGKYLATAFLISSDRRRYGELIMYLKNDYAKQQRNHPKTLTDMYGLMVVFEPMRATPVSGGCNEGLTFRNLVAEYETEGDGYHGSNGGVGRNLEFWKCVGGHLKKNCPKRAEEKYNNKDKSTSPHHVHVIGGRPIRDRNQ